MNRPDKRISRPWWRTLSNAALAVAAIAVIGVSTVTPALANWGVGFSVGGPYGYYGPGYGYYPYSAYPAYGYYPSYYGGYYGGYYPYSYGYGPSLSFSYSHR